MSTADQNVESSYGLQKDARLAAERAAANTANANVPDLDPDYPFYVIPFDPGFYGEPVALDG